jgi:hypothetical protein
VGALAGKKLQVVPAPLLSWKTFKSTYPNGLVLSRRTGFDRPYGENPYARYDDSHGSPIASFIRGHRDDRLPAMERVVAVSLDGDDVAYPFTALRRRPAINEQVGNVPIAVFWAPGTSSALDDPRIARGRDVGSTGVFDRRLDGRVLEFEPSAPGRFRERGNRERVRPGGTRHRRRPQGKPLATCAPRQPLLVRLGCVQAEDPDRTNAMTVILFDGERDAARSQQP